MTGSATSPAEAGAAALILALRSGGITDRRILDAFESVPRRLFLEGRDVAGADRDIDLPAPCGQTANAPSTVARMIDALRPAPEHKVLEVGCGSGYAASILARLSAHVVTLDRYRTLVELASARFASLRLSNAAALHADGLEGWPRHAPFDRILVSGAVDHVPQPLIDQLADRGVLVAAMGPRAGQKLVRVTRDGLSIGREELGPIRLSALVEGVARRL